MTKKPASVTNSAKKTNVLPENKKNEKIETNGQNNIVLKQLDRSADLEQAQKYFATVGIETVIINRSGTYFLISKNKYENPAKPGTNGYKALTEIVRLGAEYKAPQGYESFGPKPFSDAYGKKFDN